MSSQFTQLSFLMIPSVAPRGTLNLSIYRTAAHLVINIGGHNQPTTALLDLVLELKACRYMHSNLLGFN